MQQDVLQISIAAQTTERLFKRALSAGSCRIRSLVLGLVSGFVVALGLAGCTKEVNLALQSTSPRLVIEGVVSNDELGSYVRLSYSQDFTDQTAFTYLSDALVILKDSTRQMQDTLKTVEDHEGNPYFFTRKIRPYTGHVYQLLVQVNGNTYRARSVMPDTVSFDGITLLAEAGKLDNESVFTAVPKYVDQKGVRNYYRFEQYVNGVKDPGISVLNDNVGDGLVNERPIFTKDIDIHLGDTLTVVMIQITAPVYQYFYQLEKNQQELGGTPSNPTSNIIPESGMDNNKPNTELSPGVLGYFSAEYRQYFKAVIQED